ncbi:MAG: (Fe-S)-binding protein, partial [Methanoregula sp.]|nr:(Fe-S)-binding protein [Methanoregula sp.]
MDDWQPPGKDCGACGAKCCGDFVIMVGQGTKARTDCPFYGTSTTTIGMDIPVHAAT